MFLLQICFGLCFFSLSSIYYNNLEEIKIKLVWKNLYLKKKCGLWNMQVQFDLFSD